MQYLQTEKTRVDKMNTAKHNFDRQTFRQTGPEVLRIIAMLLIMFHHFAKHGGIEYTTFSMNNAYLNLIECGGKIGVNIFIIITGYFSCTSKFSFKKVLKLLFALEFYSISLMIISLLTGAQEFRIMLFVKGFLPFLFGNGYWFVTIYIILYVLSPILNAGIEKVSKTFLAFTICFLLLIYCVLPNTIGIIKTINNFEFSILIWFIAMYLVGAYFRKYSFTLIKRRSLSLCLLLLCVIGMFGARTAQLYYGSNLGGKLGDAIATISNYDSNSLMPLMISICLFCAFLQLRIKGNKVFFSIAKATFGVYLIHDNPLFSKYMLENIIHTKEMYESQFFIPLSIISVILLFIVCSIIEIIREKYIEKPFFSLKYVEMFITKCNSIV